MSVGIITDGYEIWTTFDKHYFNIVKESCRNKVNKIGATLWSLNDSDVIDRNIESLQNDQKVLNFEVCLTQIWIVSIFN